MVDTARKAGKILQIGYNSRFAPSNQALKKFIADGEIGEIYYARAQSLRQRGIPGWGVFIDKEKQGGGPLIDIGVHILDLTLWFMGHPKPTAASGVTYQKFGKRGDVVGFMGQWDYKKFTVEDFASALIRFDNGAAICLEASFVANIPQEVHNTTLLGTEGGATSSPPTITQEKHRSLYTGELKVPNANINTHYAGDEGVRGVHPRQEGAAGHRRARPDGRPDHGRDLQVVRRGPRGRHRLTCLAGSNARPLDYGLANTCRLRAAALRSSSAQSMAVAAPTQERRRLVPLDTACRRGCSRAAVRCRRPCGRPRSARRGGPDRRSPQRRRAASPA